MCSHRKSPVEIEPVYKPGREQLRLSTSVPQCVGKPKHGLPLNSVKQGSGTVSPGEGMLQEQFHSALVHILISVILYPRGSKGTLPVHKACLSVIPSPGLPQGAGGQAGD